MLTSGVVLFHDNARLNAAPLIRAVLEHFNWVLFDYPPYSPDLPPSDYLKNWLGSQHFNNNEEFMEGVKKWLSSQIADIINTGIQKLIPRYDKCLSSGSDC
jgi:transposase